MGGKWGPGGPSRVCEILVAPPNNGEFCRLFPANYPRPGFTYYMSARIVDKHDGSPFHHSGRDAFRVPVSEAHAPMPVPHESDM